MDELQAIVKSWRDLEGSNRDAVLATVVHVKGSAYRRPGARMLIVPDGRRVGSISGGCLEGEITKKAWWFTGSGTPVVRVYDTSSDDDAVWEFGLGCNGIVQVMLERVDTAAAAETLGFIEQHQAAGKPAVVVTVIRNGQAWNAQCGDRLLVNALGVWGGALEGKGWESRILPHARAALRDGQSRFVYEGGVELFVEWIGKPLRLVIFGAGHDAIPVAAMAKQLGWHVTVADGRPAYAKAERFPGADRVVVMPAGDPLREIAIDEETAVVFMTHNYPLDLRLLPRVLPMRPRYLGMLGPQSRTEKLFSELCLRAPATVHGPVGLDIGCDTPASIAVSIVAEIQAAVSGRAGGKLRYRSGPIHSAAMEVGGRMEHKPAEAERPAYCETTLVSHV